MKNMIFFSLEKYINTASVAIYSFIVANLVGVDIFGYISHKEAAIGILSILSLQGIDNVVQRELLHNKVETRQILGTALLIKSIFVLVSFLMLYTMTFADYNDDVKSNIIWILYILVPARALTFFSSFLIVNNKAKDFFIIGVLVTFISTIYKVIVILYSFSFYYLIFGLVVDAVLYAFMYMLYLYVNKIRLLSVNLKYIRIFSSEGMLLTLSGAMIILYSRIDQVMLEYIKGYSEVGLYTLSNKLLFLYVVLSSVFNLAFVPKLNKKNSNYKNEVKSLGLISIKIGLFMCMLNLLISPLIISVFYGDDYAEVSNLVMLSSPIIFFAFLASSTGKVLVMEGKSKHALYRNILALIINIILNIMFIPYIGAIGAVLSSIVAWMISSFLYLIINKETKAIFMPFYGMKYED